MTQNTISRRHAEILVSPEKSTYIQDVGSLNGVFINRVKIRKARLHSGDMIQFGGAAGLQEGAELGPVCSKAIMYRYVERDVGKGKERADQRNAFEGHVGDRARIVARDQERGKHEGEMLEGNGNMRAHNGKKRRRTAQGVHVASKEDRESSQQLHFDQNLESSRSKESMEARIATLQKALASAQQCQKKVFTAVGFPPSSDYQEAITALLNAVQVGREAEGRVQELETVVGAERAAKEQARQALREKDAALMVAEARVDAALAQLQEGKHVAEDQSTVKQRAAEEAVKMLQAKTAQAEALKRELKNTRRSKTALQRQLDKCRAVKTSGRSQQAKGDKGGQEEILQVLEAELGCALCSEIVMDAGVLPCSHAFCFSCVHRYLKTGPDKDPEETLRDLEVHGQCQRGLQQGEGAKGGPPDVEKGGEAFTNRAHPRACPVCRESIPAGYRPYRSSNLDVVVAVVVEALEEKEGRKAAWVRRENEMREFYNRLGGERAVCYSHAPALTSEEKEEKIQEERLRKEQARREREGGLAKKKIENDGCGERKLRGEEVTMSNVNPLRQKDIRPGIGTNSPSRTSAGETRRKPGGEGEEEEGDKGVEEEEGEEEDVCEGCNEPGHDIAECPHATGMDEEEDDEEEDGGENEEEEQDDDSERGGGW